MAIWENANWEKLVDDIVDGKYDVIKVGFKRLTDGATVPTKAHPTDSGFDLYASEDVIIEPGETVIVPTGIAVELPPGYEAQVRPRSGVTAKTKLRVQLGTIDNGYTGEIGVIVDNIAEKNGRKREAYNLLDGKIERTKFLCNSYDPVWNVQRDFHVIVNDNTYRIRKGDRIAQLVVQALPSVEAVEIENFTQDSERGTGAYGSSGV